MIKKTKNSILKRWAKGIFREKKAVVGLYIIGGFILKVDDFNYDASLKRKFTDLKSSIIENN